MADRRRLGVALADLMPGLYVSIACLVELAYRERTEGQRIDTPFSQSATMTRLLGCAVYLVIPFWRRHCWVSTPMQYLSDLLGISVGPYRMQRDLGVL